MAAAPEQHVLSARQAVARSRSRYLPGVDIRILGPIVAYADDTALNLGGMRERALLALFALSPAETLSTDRLIDELWGEDLPANPANALQALVSRLRRSVGADLILTRPPGYMLDVAPEAVDAVRFRSLVESGKFREALDLWRGTPLADFPFAEFALRERSALEELYLLAVEGRIAADLEQGGGAELVPELEELVAAHPLRESLRASQMLALYRSGRQAEALRAYTAAREVLGEELGIEPGPKLKAMEEAILIQDPKLGGASPTRRSMLPARLASFVGRDQEMIDVAKSFETSRLVTLTGAGGAGKTSLAIEVGRTLESDYPEGVWLIELAPVVDPTLVADAVVTALQIEQVASLGGGGSEGIDATELVVEYLRGRRALLIMDNCEHVIEASAALAETVLLACPSVEVMATSRDRLGIPGELLWRVPSLDSSSVAVDLFIDRAQAVNPAFSPDPDDMAVIAEICARIDGMPLAIELAAARVRSLPVAEINRRLESDIGVLSGGPRSATHRQQTLRGTIDWSYQLLDAQEADLFASLSLFHGSFALGAAEAVASDKVDDVLGSLERLIDSSMVAPVAAGRYRMLETLRVYAGEKLADANAGMRRLLNFFIAASDGAEEGLQGPEQLDWLDRIEADHDTMRATLDWSVEHAPARGLALAARLGWFWFLRGNAAEARDRLEVLLRAAGGDAAAKDRGDGSFFMALCASEGEHRPADFAAARDAYAEAGDVRGLVNTTAMLAAWDTDASKTVGLIEEATELAVEAGYDWGLGLILFLRAGYATVINDYAATVELAGAAAKTFAKLGDRWGQGYSFYSLGTALRALGEYDRAVDALTQSLEYARPMRLRREMAPVMSELGSIATMRGDYEGAERWLTEAQRYADEVPFAGSQGMVRNARGKLARIRGDLDEARRSHEEALMLYEHGHAHSGLAYTYSCLGFTAEMAGDLDAAKAHHAAAMEYAEATDDLFAVALALEGMGATLIAASDTERGVEMIHVGLSIRDGAAVPLPPGERFDVDRALEAAAADLSDVVMARAQATGAAMDRQTAIGVLLKDVRA